MTLCTNITSQVFSLVAAGKGKVAGKVHGN